MSKSAGLDARRVRRLLPVGVVGLGVIAGVMLAAFFVTRGDPPSGQASPSPTTASTSFMPSAAPSHAGSEAPSAEATSTPEPSASGTPSGPARLTWTAGRSQPGVVADVARFGDRWIAGGSMVVGPTGRAAVWTSEDGVEWSEPIVLAPEPEEKDGFWPRYWINGFGEWDGALLAFGWNGVGCCDGGYPMLWRSADGDTWEVVDIDGTTFGDEFHFPQTSVPAPDGRLAVLSATGIGGSTALFLGTDLHTWDVHPVPDADTNLGLIAFAASPQHLIVVGTVEGETTSNGTWSETTSVPAVLASTDGESWTSVDPPEPRGTIGDIAWAGEIGRFIAVGTDEAGLPFAWLTADGTSWTPIALGDEPTYMHRVTVADAVIIASGESGTPFDGDEDDTIVWSSHDGLSWWYATVLEDRVGTVEAATPESAVLITSRWTEADGSSWLSLIGTLTAGD